MLHGRRPGAANSTEEPWYPSENLGQFGLLGLLRVIRMTEADLNMLALGVDLTKLGLNLNSPDYLSQSAGGKGLAQVPVGWTKCLPYLVGCFSLFLHVYKAALWCLQ